MRHALIARASAVCAARTAAGDDGFSLIEVIVALVIFVIVAGVGATTLIEAGVIDRGNRARVSAADLAERQIELARATPATSLVDGTTSLPNVTANGTVFHLVQTISRVADGTTANVCDSPGTGGQLGYRRVTVLVTWDNMGGAKPVRSDTLRALGVGGVDPSKGAVAVAVKDRNGAGSAGQLVTLSPGGQSLTTDSDGCAVFADVSAGTYSVTVNTAGYVDSSGQQQSVQTPVNVAASSITKVRYDYDRASTLAVAYTGPVGYTAPTTLPITLIADLFPGNRTKTDLDCSAGGTAGSCVSGIPRTIPNLYPTAQGYGSYAGDCADAAPPTATQYAAVIPGQSSAGTAALAGVNVNVTDTKGMVNPGVVVYATHVGDAGCPSGETFLVGPSGATPMRVALPYGTWTFNTSKPTGKGSGTSTPVTLSANQSPIPTTNLVVK